MKRILSSILALVMTITCCCGVAFATESSDTRASLTLSGYGAWLAAGSSSGVICISYDVRSSKLADSLGVASIVIYNSNGNKVATITGSTSNGLIRTDSSIKAGDYNYKLTSGATYYAEVTVFAEVGSEYDSRTVTTGTVKAP